MEIARGTAVRLGSGETGVSRAAFLQLGAAGSVALLGMTGGGRAARALSGLLFPQPAPLARSAFTPYAGSTFRIRSGGQGAPLVRARLTEVADLGRVKASDDAFSLTFTAGRDSAPLASGIHQFEHPRLGRYELAIGPVGRGARVRDYQAVVNRVPGSPGRRRN